MLWRGCILRTPTPQPSRNPRMQRVNEYNLYELAAKIHPLADLEAGKLSNIWFNLWQARSEIRSICEVRPLNYLLSAIEKLITVITQLVPEDFDEAIAAVPNSEDEEDVPYWRLNR